MKIKSVRVLFFAISAVVHSFLFLGGCVGTQHDAENDGEGSAAVGVVALSATNVRRVTETVTGPGIATPIAVSLTKSQNEWQGTIDGIPAGPKRSFTVSASDAGGVEIYHGKVTGVTITANQTASVVINAQQTSPNSSKKNAPPIISALVASSVNVGPKKVVTLIVSAHDPDAEDTLTYAWTANGGSVSAPAAPSTQWTAPATEGTYRVNIRVRDQENAQSTMSVDITVMP
jgi:hypothetical protein